MTCDDSSQFFRTVEESGLWVPGKKEIFELNGEGAKITRGLSQYLPIIFSQLHIMFLFVENIPGVTLVIEEKEMMQFEKQLPFAQVI